MCGEFADVGGWDEPDTSFAPQTVRARQAYPCAFCDAGIGKGEYHSRWSYVMDGSFVTSRYHLRCRDASEDNCY